MPILGSATTVTVAQFEDIGAQPNDGLVLVIIHLYKVVDDNAGVV